MKWSMFWRSPFCPATSTNNTSPKIWHHLVGWCSTEWHKANSTVVKGKTMPHSCIIKCLSIFSKKDCVEVKIQKSELDLEQRFPNSHFYIFRYSIKASGDLSRTQLDVPKYFLRTKMQNIMICLNEVMVKSEHSMNKNHWLHHFMHFHIFKISSVIS